mmetsp:Transcript_41170/g.90379  ORF Transcript_41170/g.90379 Transcript_41170/m.90379 type:complete len:361 (+) Transcript_41170:390-1472(+)
MVKYIPRAIQGRNLAMRRKLAMNKITKRRHCSVKQVYNAPTVESFVLGQLSLIWRPRELIRPAVLLAPAYFALNYTYFLSLDLTSISETMILSASTGLWTLLFSKILLNETFSRLKLLSVLISSVGLCLVTYNSHETAAPGPEGAQDASNSIAGDMLALLSAVSSGMYVVLLRALVPDEDRVHMPSLFGGIGLSAALLFLPLFPLLHFSGVEPFELPPSRSALAAVLLNALLSTVLPDMLLAKAVVMTSPLLATLGLSLMIPLSVIADYIQGLARVSPGFYAGTLAVFIGFQLESHAEAKLEEDEQMGDLASDLPDFHPRLSEHHLADDDSHIVAEEPESCSQIDVTPMTARTNVSYERR